MKPRIAIFGDVLLDRYDYCENRGNPESSAPCHRVKKTLFLPGGAGNVAANLAALGAEVVLFGLVGRDEHGRCLIDELSKLNISQRLLTDETTRTIVKQRILSTSDGRYHGRLDFGDDAAAIEKIKSLNSKILDKISPLITNGFDACIVSDYDKGFITSELMNEIKKIGTPIYVDPKNNKNLYRNVELIKPNRVEISAMVSARTDQEKAEQLSKELNTNVLLTLGENGMYYAGKEGSSFSLPAHTSEVSDVTGCGDTVIATLAFYRTLGKSMKESIELSNKAAGISVQHIGCYHVKREEIE
ncbi:MAG: PfkB family carbohydrate kinase [Nanoarchaeota archaeon]